MALLQGNVITIDVSREQELLSPLLLLQNMSESRLQREGMGKYIIPKTGVNLD